MLTLTPEQSAAASILAGDNPLQGIVPETPAPPPYVPPPSAPTAGQEALAPASAANTFGMMPKMGVSPSIAEQMMKLADQHAQANPQAASAPGGWARAILAGAQGALSGFQDVSTKRGGGAIAGISETLANRNNRLNAQKQQAFENQRKLNAEQMEIDRNHALNANTNAQTYHTQLLSYLAGDESQQANIDRGKKDDAAMANQEVATPLVKEGVTADEMNKLMQEGHLNGHEYHAFPVDRREVGEDPVTHKPIYETLYNVREIPASYTFTDPSIIARVNKFRPGTNLSTDPEHPQVMKGSEALHLIQAANANETAQFSIDHARRQAGLEEMQFKNEKERQEHLEEIHALQPDLNTVLGKTRNDPLKALQEFQKNPILAKKYPNATQDIMDIYGGTKEWETMRVDREKEAHQRALEAQDDLGKAGYIMTDDMKAQIAALPPDKQAVIMSVPEGSRAAIMGVAFGPGDVNFRDIFTRTAKGQKILSPQEAYDKIHQLNPNWDEKQYKIMGDEFGKILHGPESIEINNYNNVLKHAAAAQDVLESIKRDKPAIFNKALNKWQNAGVGTDARAIQTALEPVHEEFETLMLSGHAPQSETLKAYNTIFDPGSTGPQLETAFKIIGGTGAIRLDTKNERFKSMAGRNIPGLLTREAYDAAKHLNLDPEAMRTLNKLDIGGTLFHSPSWKEPSQADVEKQHNDQLSQEQARKAADAEGFRNAKQFSHGPDGREVRGVNGRWVYADGTPLVIPTAPAPVAGTNLNNR